MASPLDPGSRAYKPGQIVPISGVYTIIHLDHRPPHEAVAVRGDLFPACRICKEQVRFQVAQIVPHVTHDFDLAGPTVKMHKGRAKAKAANGGEG